MKNLTITNKIFKLIIVYILLLFCLGCGSSGGGGGGDEESPDKLNSSADTIPSSFTFIAQNGVTRNTAITSNTITVSGINSASSIVISGEGATYSVNDGAFTDVNGTVNNDDTVSVRTTSSLNYNTTVAVILTIGGISSTFNVTTESDGSSTDTVPDSFNFTSQYGVARSTTVTSNNITVSGINDVASIVISGEGAIYSVNGGTYTNATSTVNNDDTVSVRVTSSSSYNETVAAILTIGGISVVFNVTTESENSSTDTTPTSFIFTAQNGVARNTTVTSNTITVSGINSAASIFISGAGGTYSINGGAYTNTNEAVNNGDTVCVRVTSSPSYNATITAILTIGGVSGSFHVITGSGGFSTDVTPNSFTFISQTGVARGSAITSNQITVTGIDAATSISVSGADGTYSINEGIYTSSAGTVNSGDIVSVRITSPLNYNATASAILVIGGVSGTFNVTAESDGSYTDITPDSFSFNAQAGVARSSAITSDPIIVGGINKATSMYISGAEGTYSINGGSYTNSTGTVSNGDTISVRLISSPNYNAAVSAILTIGGILGTFNVTTESGGTIADSTPDAFAFTSQTGVFRNIAITSNQVTVSGINAATAVSIAGANGTYSINGGDFTDSTSMVADGDAICVRLTTSTSYETAVSTFLMIGSVTRTFTATTLSEAITTNDTLRVRVVGRNEDTLPDATVVLGAQNGSMVDYGLTDINGEITFTNPPVNAIVTAAYVYTPDGQTTPRYSLEAYYDVNVAAMTLQLYDSTYYDDNSALGTGTVTIINTVGAAYWELSGVNENYSNYDQLIRDFTVNQDHLQSDGTFSIVVVGYDTNNNPVGYGTLLDQTFTDGMSVDIAIDKINFGSLTYTISNVPAMAESISCGMSSSRKAGSINHEYLGVDRTFHTPIPVSVPVSYIPGVGDSWAYYVKLFLNENDYENGIWIYRRSDTLSNQTIDFNQLPAIPSDLSMASVGTDNPKVSWSGNAKAAYVNINLHNSSTGYYYVYEIFAPPTRSSIVFPQLPDSLSALRPSWADGFNINYYKSSIISGYNDLLEIMERYYSGTYTPSILYDSSYSTATYSTVGSH